MGWPGREVSWQGPKVGRHGRRVGRLLLEMHVKLEGEVSELG